MRVIIDANTNTLELFMNDTDSVLYSVKQPRQQWLILTEIFNRLDHSGVSLDYIDEDHRSTEEW